MSPNGIYGSADGGSNWTQVLSGNPSNSVIFDPTNGSVAYATATGIYKSTDAGQTWTPINGSGTSALPVANAGRIALAMAPSSPTTLYAGIVNNGMAIIVFSKLPMEGTVGRSPRLHVITAHLNAVTTTL